MYYLLLIFFLSFHLSLLGQVEPNSDTAKIRVSETFWATPNKVYLDSAEIVLDKTFMDTNNIEQIIFYKENSQSLHKVRVATLITRKKNVKLLSLADLCSALNLTDSTPIRFVIDKQGIEDTSDIRFEPAVIKKIDIHKSQPTRAGHGFERSIQILIETQYGWRRRGLGHEPG